MSTVPSYRLHKPTGQAVVRIKTLEGKKKDVYLGRFGTPESRKRYEQVIGDYLSRKPVRKPRKVNRKSTELTISHVCLAYWRHAERYYRKNGKPTTELPGVQASLKMVREMFGSTSATEFGPLKLKALQTHLEKSGLSRKYINKSIGRIKRMFKWAASEELIPIEVHLGLSTVSGLKKGRTEAVEYAPIQPVAEEDVEATLPHLPRYTADMIRVQRLTGMRPAEVCAMRPDDIDRSQDVWVYRPGSHKTEHHGKDRVVPIGPQAQAILTPYLFRGEKACFHGPRSPLGFHTRSYRDNVHRACKRAGIDEWNPNQLRHSAATAIRAAGGIEAAQVVLGHSSLSTTEIYAEKNLQAAIAIVREVG